ncbi:MAG: helix-turn-helix domain-containing protein [Actinophytocola sp.]|uniref:helix-turn-helix domain-containing protein n=1 Tax=Actinophytocola sp. TaxID=1872138 RepID=UPI001329853C|nr:helix-turn-helix transcriptional regulator [Actinophytocola sp.]MPZ84043.1 helix-turn-helix domain-containing protein [Actinophytocola sp.]
MAEVGQTLRRRKLGKELRRARESAGLSQRDVTKEARLQPGTISKIENGRQAILPRNVKLILQACGVGAPTMDTLIRLAEESDDVGWWIAFSDTIPDWFATYVDLESDADQIWTYTSELIDGLLQTPEYAEAVARAAYPNITDDELRRSVELRTARQSQLDRENPAELHIVMSEAVIRWPVGGPETMRSQLLHVATMARRPKINIQVLPFSVGAHPGMKCPFTLLRFPEGFDDMDCVYLENENGELWQERPGDITRYTEVFHRLRSLALSREDTITLLDSLV